MDEQTRKKDRLLFLLRSRGNDVQEIMDLISEGVVWSKEETQEGLTALMYAAVHRYQGAVWALLAAGADPDERSVVRAENGGYTTALILAAETGDAVIVRALLGAGADPDGADDRGRTPLLYAACDNRPDVAFILLQWGADPYRKDDLGVSPMESAEGKKHAHIVDDMREACLKRATAGFREGAREDIAVPPPLKIRRRS